MNTSRELSSETRSRGHRVIYCDEGGPGGREAGAERQWAKREKQATKAIVNMARMYGGVQGIVERLSRGYRHLNFQEEKIIRVTCI